MVEDNYEIDDDDDDDDDKLKYDLAGDGRIEGTFFFYSEKGPRTQKHRKTENTKIESKVEISPGPFFETNPKPQKEPAGLSRTKKSKIYK